MHSGESHGTAVSMYKMDIVAQGLLRVECLSGEGESEELEVSASTFAPNHRKLPLPGAQKGR